MLIDDGSAKKKKKKKNWDVKRKVRKLSVLTTYSNIKKYSVLTEVKIRNLLLKIRIPLPRKLTATISNAWYI